MSELIAGEMRRLKKQSGLSFAKLAARTHYSRSSWERFLNGKKPVPREAVEQFASVMGDWAGALLLMEGSEEAGRATHAGQATYAGQATHAGPAGQAAPATPATQAAQAGQATQATQATQTEGPWPFAGSGKPTEAVAAGAGPAGAQVGARWGRGPSSRRPSPAEWFAAGVAVGALALAAAAGWWAGRAGGARGPFGRCPCAADTAGVPPVVSHGVPHAVPGVPNWWDGAYDG
ncbi:helix-turn-helix domain-containing protein [Streptomyces sp. NPDC008159]|uniref:helix-turn-helix domain-containing protein n=1 Tax=Streptomyces sp. NPDC008159 TaxID=3364817 RepID=UPI0036E5E744